MGTAGGHVSADPFGRIRGAALKEMTDMDGSSQCRQGYRRVSALIRLFLCGYLQRNRLSKDLSRRCPIESGFGS